MEENKNGISFLAECEDCKTKFEVGSKVGTKTLIGRKRFEAKGRSIFLTYYDCPSCGRRHWVQIDDETSAFKLAQVKKQFIKLSVAKSKDEIISKKQSDKFKKARKDLSVYRMNLMKEFTGESIYDDETKTEFILRFSV